METTQLTDEISGEIKNVLFRLGFVKNLAGYRCLIHEIQIYHADPDQSMTKQLYPEVGHLCDPELSAHQVERSIRYAIDAAWSSGNAGIWRKYFPQDRKPTNWEFLSRMSELPELWGNRK